MSSLYHLVDINYFFTEEGMYYLNFNNPRAFFYHLANNGNEIGVRASAHQLVIL